MPDVPQGPHQCPHCERSFPKGHGLRVHLSRVHKGGGPAVPDAERKRKDRLRKRAQRRRGAAIVKATPPPAEAADGPEVNYCPHCGTNIALINQVLAVAKGVASGRR